MTPFLQSLVLALSFLFIFIWQNTSLSSYTVPFLGFFVFIYILLSARRKGLGFLTMGGNGPWGIFILQTIILLIIFSTGGLSSSLFFLLYFLSFGIAFVFEPAVIFVFVVLTILIFLPAFPKDDVMGNYLKLFSLLLISPLAYFFGKQYRQQDKEEEKINALEERTKDAADTIATDVEKVLKDQKQSLKQETTERLNEILEETENLRQETKDK